MVLHDEKRPEAKVITKGMTSHGCSLCPYINEEMRAAQRHAQLHNALLKDGKFLNYHYVKKSATAVKRGRTSEGAKEGRSKKPATPEIPSKKGIGKQKNLPSAAPLEKGVGSRETSPPVDVALVNKALGKREPFYEILDCNGCPFLTIDPILQKRHSPLHTRPSVCPMCNVRYDTPGMFQHLILEHSRVQWNFSLNEIKDSLARLCSYDGCTFYCTKRKVMRAHFRCHVGDGLDLKCPVVGCKEQTPQSATDAHNHLRSHFEDRPFSCPVCRKFFSDSEDALDHVECIPVACFK